MTPGILQMAGAFDVMIERGFKYQLTEWRMTFFLAHYVQLRPGSQ